MVGVPVAGERGGVEFPADSEGEGAECGVECTDGALWVLVICVLGCGRGRAVDSLEDEQPAEGASARTGGFIRRDIDEGVSGEGRCRGDLPHGAAGWICVRVVTVAHVQRRYDEEATTRDGGRRQPQAGRTRRHERDAPDEAPPPTDAGT